LKRRLLIAAAALVVVLVGLVVGGFVYLTSPAGRVWLAGKIEEAVSEPGVMELKLGAIGPGLPGHITVESASVADAEGVWLEAEDLAIDWDPWSLLSRRLQVSRIDLAALTVFRQPLPAPESEGPGSAEAEGFSMPALPFDIEIENLAVAHLVLGEPLLGTPAELDIKAVLDATRAGDIKLDLAVERIDGVGGSLNAEADIDLGEGKLALSAEAYEPPDGVIVHALGLEPYPEFRLNLDGEGPASGWAGTLRASAGELLAVDVTARVAAGETVALNVDGSARAAAMLPDELKPIVGPDVTFAADIDLDGDRVTFKTLAVAMQALSVTGEGSIDTAVETVDARIALEGRDPAPIAALVEPLAFRSWRVSLTAAGNLAAPQLTVDGGAEAVALPDIFSGDLAISARAEPDEAGGWRLEGTVDASGAGMTIGAAQTLLGAGPRLTFALDADQAFGKLSDLSFSLTGDNVDLGVHGDLDLEAFSGAVVADVAIADVTSLSGEIGLPVSGGLDLRADLKLDPGLSRAKGTIALAGDTFAVGQRHVDAFIGDELDISGEIDTDLATQLSLIDLMIKTEALDLAGSLQLQHGFADVSGRLDGPLAVTQSIAEALYLDPVGRAAVTLRLAGPVDDPVVRAQANLDGMAAQGVSLDKVAAHAEIREVTGNPRGEVLVTLPTPAGETKVALAFVIEEVDVVVPQIAVAGPGIEARGALRLGGDDILTGNLQGEAVDMSALAAMAGLDASGSAVFRFDLASDELGGQGAVAAIDVTNLALATDEAEAVTARQIRVNATLADLDGSPTGRADASFGAVAYQTYTIDGAVMNVSAVGDVIDVELGAQGSAGVPLTVDLASEVDLGDEDLVVTFSRLDGTVGGQDFAQEGTLRIVVGDNELQLAGLALSMAGGRVEADVRRAPDNLDAEVTISGLSLDVVEVFVPGSALTGVIDGTADLATSGGVIVGAVDIRASDIDLSEGVGDEGVPADIQLTAHLAPTGVEAEVILSGIPGSELDGRASIGAAIDAATLSVQNARMAPLDASLNLQARLQTIWDDLPASDQRMRGDLSAQLTATGTVGNPSISGQASLADGSYEHLVYGTLLNDIALSVVADSTRNLAIHLSANDGGKGTVAADGEIAFGDAEQVSATLTFNSATLIRRDDVTASASGDIRYAGSFLEGAITGTVTTETIEVNLVNSLPASVVVLDVTDVYDTNGNGRAAGRSSLWSASLDIAIDMPRRVFVRGRGVDTEWYGNVHIGGTTNAPVIDGKLEIERGIVSVVGRAFEMTRGTVELDPEEPDNPTIDIVAQNSRQDVTGIITISGRASDPTIEITSVPSMPEAEVLPRVLFGKSASNLSAFEAFEMASAVAQLTGVGGDLGLLDRARQTLGIDVLRVGTNDEGATTVGAGSYVTERVYVGVEQSTGSQTGAVKVEVEVTDDVTVTTSTGTDASANVGVNWRWDY